MSPSTSARTNWGYLSFDFYSERPWGGKSSGSLRAGSTLSLAVLQAILLPTAAQAEQLMS